MAGGLETLRAALGCWVSGFRFSRVGASLKSGLGIKKSQGLGALSGEGALLRLSSGLGSGSEFTDGPLLLNQKLLPQAMLCMIHFSVTPSSTALGH